MPLKTKMNSQASPCKDSAFDQLAPPVKKWIWKQGWASLREIQIEAIPYLLTGGDTIISAATAGGKTEAAFLPLLSRVFNKGPSCGFDILYISPLKALINDQFMRLEGLCEDLCLPVTKWHGDVGASIKQKALENPSGVLLITPESLESLLMRKGMQIHHLFGETQAVVVDELHAFMGTERGVQLRSLMNRLEILTEHKIDRIGLSATLGDMTMAAEYLRNKSKSPIPIIKGNSGGTELKLQLRSYQQYTNNQELPPSIAEHIFKKVRGTRSLIFAGSKKKVELYGVTLRDLCIENNQPNEFFTHHANISKPDRETLERRLKEGRLPTSAVCTSTLELGIDIGDVETIVQLGCSSSVAALRQRLGRSGRRDGSPAILRAYHLYHQTNKADILECIRPQFIQATAEIELLLAGVYEPPVSTQLHLSTLVHQIMALIVERGGANAKSLFNTLSHAAPFDNITSTIFMAILRAMAKPGSDLIEQAPDGVLLLGKKGEYLTSNYKFYAVFEWQEEFRVLFAGKELGTLTIAAMRGIFKGMEIIFSGRRWQIVNIRINDKVIDVKPTKGGRARSFLTNGASRHRIIDEKMFEIYCGRTELQYLDAPSATLLKEGRGYFHQYAMDKNNAFPKADGVILFPWAGSIMTEALMLIFQHKGYQVTNDDYALSVKDISLQKVHTIIDQLACGKIPDIEQMAWTIENKSMGQYDSFLTDDILVQQLVSALPSADEFQEWAKRFFV